ncbi:NTP transferase domain-containing protein [Helicobacter winghamensis]|uniref:NTP transferase domain-containing protein n=1 Tax=Helicobacter winghamensis TaxID=157268 RepID=UPI0027A723CE
MNIIIPATGIGKRFKEAGYRDLKPFIEVKDDKVILDYVIECFDMLRDVFYFIVRESEKNKFENFIQSRKINAEIIIYEGAKLGPAGSLYGVVAKLQDIMNEEVIISYCDFGQEWSYGDFLTFVQQNQEAQGIIPCYTGYHPHLTPLENVYAACKVHENSFKVYKVIEKFYSDNKFQEYYSSGIYYFKTLKLAIEAIQKQMESQDMIAGEYYISTTNNYLKNTLCFPFIKRFYQFGTPKDFEYAKYKLNHQDFNSESIKIDNTVILAAGRGERFFNVGVKQPKPFLPLGKSTLIENIIGSLKKVETDIVCVGAQDHQIYWSNVDQKVRLIEPNKIGAAYSYKTACGDLEGDVLILSCDLMAKYINSEFKKMQKKYEIIIFVAKATQFNEDNPFHFAWIQGKNGNVSNISIKKREDNADLVLIGSFYFKENSLLLKYIDRIFKEDIRTNGEFYIDNALKLIHETHAIGYVVVDDYFSFGTPEEYYENAYWFNG